MFDDLASDMSSTLTGVFGDRYAYRRQGRFEKTVPAVIRRDTEAFGDDGQVVGRTNTVRLTHSDIDFVPERGDVICDRKGELTLGVRLANDGYSYLFEATS